MIYLCLVGGCTLMCEIRKAYVKYKKAKTILRKIKIGFSDVLSYSASQKSKERRGNAITHPQSHVEFRGGMGVRTLSRRVLVPRFSGRGLEVTI